MERISNIDSSIEATNRILERVTSVPCTILDKTVSVPVNGRTKFKLYFQAVGWVVELIHDYRDGDYWRFS
jgi:hypothetical protein